MKSVLSNSYIVDGKICMCCTKCGREVIGVGEETTSVTCSNCVSRMIPLEEPKGYKPTGRPAGWHWMKEFVDKDGNVFHKGKEVSELKGTLSPTKIKPKKTAKAKRRTKEQMLLARYKKKKKALKRDKKKNDSKK